jgi:hypothetical protein
MLGKSFHELAQRLRELSAVVPLHTRPRANRERLQLVLVVIDGPLEFCVVCARSRDRERRLSIGLEAIAVDAELVLGIEIAAINTRSTAASAFRGINLTLELVPGSLLRREECHAASRPAVVAPLGSLVVGVNDLLESRKSRTIRCTYGRGIVIGKDAVADVEHLAGPERSTQNLLCYLCSLARQEIVAKDLVDVNELVVDQHGKHYRGQHPEHEKRYE